MTATPRVDGLDVATYTVPTDGPEADGTLQWDATTVVLVTIRADGAAGQGWTYSSPAVAMVIANHLREVVVGHNPGDITGAWQAMRRVCRNYGTRGLIMQAISAVDIALWDLTARLHGRSLTDLLGHVRCAVPIYGSGGFTNLDDDHLAQHIAQWRAAGCTAMKIKIGQDWGHDIDRDLARVQRLGELAGAGVDLMVDANGGYTRGQARRVGAALDELGVVWFEEPVSSDDLEGLDGLRRALRCDVTAGEYVSDIYAARALVPVVDCLQLDVTRCGGYTGWLAAAALAAAHNLDVSAHCAPALHVSVAAAVSNVRHIEYFVDHTRLEPLLFDGIPAAADGHLHLDATRAGHGMTIADRAEKYRKS